MTSISPFVWPIRICASSAPPGERSLLWRSPDAAWVPNGKLAAVSKEQRRKFPPVSPDFVVEVMSPSHRLKTAKDKIDVWIAGGVQLAWLIDPDHKTIYVYRPSQAEPDRLQGLSKLAAVVPSTALSWN